VSPRAGLDAVEKRNFLILQGLELQILGRAAHSQLLYRLLYLGSDVATTSDRNLSFNTLNRRWGRRCNAGSMQCRLPCNRVCHVFSTR
jgi:hypothetical protein